MVRLSQYLLFYVAFEPPLSSPCLTKWDVVSGQRGWIDVFKDLDHGRQQARAENPTTTYSPATSDIPNSKRKDSAGEQELLGDPKWGRVRGANEELGEERTTMGDAVTHCPFLKKFIKHLSCDYFG